MNELNLSEGLAGTIMDQIVDQKCQDHARNDALTICHGELFAAAHATNLQQCCKNDGQCIIQSKTYGADWWKCPAKSKGYKETEGRKWISDCCQETRSRSVNKMKGWPSTSEGTWPWKLGGWWCQGNGLLIQAPRRQQDANHKKKTNQVISTYHELLQGRKITSERGGTCNSWRCWRWECWRWRCQWRIMRIAVVFFMCYVCGVSCGEHFWIFLCIFWVLYNWKINLLTYVDIIVGQTLVFI